MVIILRGAQGSGKTFFLQSGRIWEYFKPGRVRYTCSADYWMVNERGEYEFVPAKLPEAHAKCLLSFVNYMDTGRDTTVVVDNTNSTVAEIAPYYALGQAYGHEVIIVTLDVDPEVAFQRQLHGVSRVGFNSMVLRLKEQEILFPPWWEHRTITNP